MNDVEISVKQVLSALFEGFRVALKATKIGPRFQESDPFMVAFVA